MIKCTTNKYDKLYARWLEHPGKLLDLAEFNQQDVVLDLCGGTGAVANEAIRRGAEYVYLLDLNPRCTDPKITAIRADAHNPLAYTFLPKIDLCVIRQSLGYLDLHTISGILSHALPSGSRVAFNGFLHPRWRLFTYKYGGKMFLEASGHLFGHVGHIQASLNGIDFSMFRHHSIGSIYAAFQPHFQILKVEVTHTSFRMVLIRT